VADARTGGLTGIRQRLVTRLRERGTYRRWVLITALVGMFATTFPVTILTVALPDIADEFGRSDALLTWVISAPMLASAVALPVLGKMGDLRGQRRVFLAGFSAATVVAGATAFAWSAFALIGLRTLTQVIGSATQPTSMALIMRAFPPEERVKAMGWWSLVAAGAPAIGLAVGGPLVDMVGWRVVFAVQAALAVIPVVAATLVLEETPPAHAGARFDVGGAVSIGFAAGGLMLALNQSADWGWAHPAVIGGLVVCPLAVMAFVRIERRVPHPLLPLELLGRRNFTATLIAQALAGSTYMGGFVMTPFLMRGVFGWSLSSIALLMLIRPLSYSLSSPVGGQIGSRIGERSGALLGNVMLASAMGLFAAGASLETVWLVGGGLLVQGIGNGVARPSLGAVLANSVDEADLGIASATQRMARLIGNASGIAVLTAVYAGSQTPSSFAAAYLVAVGLGVLAVAATARIDADRARGEAVTPPPGRAEATDAATTR
jgi:MFS family permease